MAPQPNPSAKKTDAKGKNVQAVARRGFRRGELAGFRALGLVAGLLPMRSEERGLVSSFLKKPDLPVS